MCIRDRPSAVFCKDGEGNLIGDKEKMLNRWMKHFKHVLYGGLRANADEEADDDPITLNENEGNYEDDESTRSKTWKK